MTKLGNMLKTLRGSRTLDDCVAGTGIARETLRKAESGQPVKIDTLHTLARQGLHATDAQWKELLSAWLNHYARPWSHLVTIGTVGKTAPVAKAIHGLLHQIQSAAAELPTTDQCAILKALRHPEVVRSIRHLNTLFDSKK